MSKEFYISHPQDRHDATNEIKNIPYPYILVTKRMPPNKTHEDEYQKRQRLMAFFHRSICVEYADAAGVTEEQAKGELQIKFARCGEVMVDEAGEFDVCWLEEDKFRIMEQGKHYYVESIASMGVDRLSEFCNKCRDYLLIQYGVQLKTFINNFKTKML